MSAPPGPSSSLEVVEANEGKRFFAAAKDKNFSLPSIFLLTSVSIPDGSFYRLRQKKIPLSGRNNLKEFFRKSLGVWTHTDLALAEGHFPILLILD